MTTQPTDGSRTCEPSAVLPFEHAVYRRFAGLPCPVCFSDCPRLLPEARRFFHAWPSEPYVSGNHAQGIEIRPCGDTEQNGYLIHAPHLNRPLHEPTAASALCSLAIELVAAFCEDHQQIFCLHAAAVRLHGDTTLFLGNNRAGKSTLIVRLMADGQTSFGDDLIGVTDQKEVLSFGIPPRLRLPLPPSEPLSAFVDRNSGIQDERYRYVHAEDALSTAFGQHAPLRKILILRRRSGGKTGFVRLSRQEALQNILPHYVMRKGSADAVLAHASMLAQTVPAFLFFYTDLDEAVPLLRDVSERRTPPEVPPTVFPCRSGTTRRPLCRRLPKNGRKGSATRTCIRKKGVRLVSACDNIFLIDDGADAVHALNASGAAVWNLLEHPLSEEEAVLLLGEAFRDVPKARIRHDVSNLFRALKEKKLIQETDIC